MTLWGKRDDMVVHEREPFNAEPPRRALAGSPITTLDSFYSRNHGPVPQVDAATWRLEVDGLVRRPLSLSLDDLRDRFEHHEVTATLQCAGNRRAGLMEVRDIPGEDPWGPCATSTARWTGVRLADVLAEAALLPDAAHIAFAAPDVSQIADPPQPYGGSIPAGKALSGEVLLAWAMNGRPLPRIHGAPLRAVVPGWIGARSVKWLQRVTAQREPSENYFQAVAYRLLPPEADPDKAGPSDGISLGPVALNCEILRPDGTGPLPPGPTEITGYAFAGDDRTVARLDVSLDDGSTWAQADLDEPRDTWAWQLWRITLDLPPGETTITARAWDCTAAVQPGCPGDLWNPKGYANNSWARLRLTCRP
ncbi:sulfite oxidase [Planotetraspora thailandica]|uniref:Sulfite oxidase n=1 Tax=Planotetraspora thailandica TaxID=487172 RepID=A0A8J3V5D1_9ACTN|nr:sulfite oxidase [Planotetraspora thailandica]GII57688.1 sulfite oxidase [Planotetraspora thailandica]